MSAALMSAALMSVAPRTLAGERGAASSCVARGTLRRLRPLCILDRYSMRAAPLTARPLRPFRILLTAARPTVCTERAVHCV